MKQQYGQLYFSIYYICGPKEHVSTDSSFGNFNGVMPTKSFADTYNMRRRNFVKDVSTWRIIKSLERTECLWQKSLTALRFGDRISFVLFSSENLCFSHLFSSFFMQRIYAYNYQDNYVSNYIKKFSVLTLWGMFSLKQYDISQLYNNYV